MCTVHMHSTYLWTQDKAYLCFRRGFRPPDLSRVTNLRLYISELGAYIVKKTEFALELGISRKRAPLVWFFNVCFHMEPLIEPFRHQSKTSWHLRGLIGLPSVAIGIVYDQIHPTEDEKHVVRFPEPLRVSIQDSKLTKRSLIVFIPGLGDASVDIAEARAPARRRDALDWQLTLAGRI
jgi:hypothetical protein